MFSPLNCRFFVTLSNSLPFDSILSAKNGIRYGNHSKNQTGGSVLKNTVEKLGVVAVVEVGAEEAVPTFVEEPSCPFHGGAAVKAF